MRSVSPKRFGGVFDDPSVGLLGDSPSVRIQFHRDDQRDLPWGRVFGALAVPWKSDEAELKQTLQHSLSPKRQQSIQQTKSS